MIALAFYYIFYFNSFFIYFIHIHIYFAIKTIHHYMRFAFLNNTIFLIYTHMHYFVLNVCNICT